MMREVKPKGIRRSRHVACKVGKILLTEFYMEALKDKEHETMHR